MSGWDQAATAERYERFCREHARYTRANEVLVGEAGLEAGHAVLDFGAGTGRTASAALRLLGPRGSVVCVEPAAAMRAAGERRLRDRRVAWCAALADACDTGARFDRVLAGAMIWQLEPLDEWIARLAALLRPGGALAFNVPALYLGEPDAPGAGRDPLLLDLVARLAAEAAPIAAAAAPPRAPLCRATIEDSLASAGLAFRAWEFRYRLTQTAHARWLAIPVLTDMLLAGAAPSERERRIERALAEVDGRSFKWERWRGWTAWKL
jgi:SAM-dependent methyltransferase